MASELRQFLADAASLGFIHEGYTGSGHLRLVHPTAGVYIASGTPSCQSTIRKSLADMERQCGKKLPRANSGALPKQTGRQRR